MRIILVLSLIFGSVAAKESVKSTMSIQVKNTILRDKPSFLGKNLATLKYAQTVRMIETQNGWAKVFISNLRKNGWLHLSSLSDKRIVLKQNAQNVQTTASSGEIIMAGKGFSKEVEERYKQEHTNLDYALVDVVERQNISNSTAVKFAQNGQLNINR